MTVCLVALPQYSMAITYKRKAVRVKLTGLYWTNAESFRPFSHDVAIYRDAYREGVSCGRPVDMIGAALAE